ncbi:MAG: PD-(D/E)XK nuclease family protein, partial [Gammaproteobacteria bacterium]|nr:PD-(D/E)XK nuclease family protein [Gammaproteobacteria bacterium]
LPRFLQELRELRDSADDAPDEGKLGAAGDAVRIYTVHESKGLEAPIVWLLDANAERQNRDGSDVLLDWPTHEAQPLHFSLYADQASRGKKRMPLFEQDAAEQAREEMNLLYVAMTRAQQALVVSGSQGAREVKQLTWYGRIAGVIGEQKNPLHFATASIVAEVSEMRKEGISLPVIIPTGQRAARNTTRQQRGIWLHALLQHLTEGRLDQAALQEGLGIPAAEIESLWQQAQSLLAAPQLARFFDARQFHTACNEMPYINAKGELKRIDRLVEFDDEVWVLDYKLGDSDDAARYRAQMAEYQSAMRAVYASKEVKCALLFADGVLSELQ